MARIVGLIAPLVALVWVHACASSLPVPKTGPHSATHTSYVEVPYPPPAARVEVIPPPPKEYNAVWVDGEWAWQGKRWVWTTGGWVAPPAGAYLAPWLTYRLESGKLLFVPGSWHAPDGRLLPRPTILAAARNGLEDVSPAPSAGSPPAPGSSPSPAASTPPPAGPPPSPVGSSASPAAP